MRVVDYNGRQYNVADSADPSCGGSITEIINMDEYELKRFVDLETTIIDIGANHGIATIILAKQNPKSIVYTFEPDPDIFKQLVANISLNNLTNVVAECMAVSDDSSKVLELMKHPRWSGGNTTCSEPEVFRSFFPGEQSSVVKVPCISFDDIIAKHNITKVGLLKIDCEGAEFEILYSSKRFQESIVENIVGEYHDLKYNTKAANNSSTLMTFTENYVKGFKKITFLTI